MRKLLEKLEPEDIGAFSGMIGCFIGIIILRQEPNEASTFKDILIYIVVYYLGKKREQIKKNGNNKGSDGMV